MIIIRLSSYRRLALAPFCLLVLAFVLFAAVDAPSYQQDGAPLVIFGNSSGPVNDFC